MIAHEFKLATQSIYNWLNQGKLDLIYLNQRSKYNQPLG